MKRIIVLLREFWKKFYRNFKILCLNPYFIIILSLCLICCFVDLYFNLFIYFKSDLVYYVDIDKSLDSIKYRDRNFDLTYHRVVIYRQHKWEVTRTIRYRKV